MRDPASLNKPSTSEIGAANMIGIIPGTDVHWGLVFGIVAAILAYLLIFHTTFGFAARIAGGNVRAAKAFGLGVGRLVLIVCFLAGAAPGSPAWSRSPPCRAAPTPTRRRLRLHRDPRGLPRAAQSARHHPGRAAARRHQCQRRAPATPLGLPDASVLVLQGMIFVAVLASETLYGRFRIFRPGHGHDGRRDRLVGGADCRARRRAAREHAVSVRQPRRVHHRAERAASISASKATWSWRDVCLRHLVSDGLALARRAGGGRLRRAARAVACRDLRLPRVNDIAVGIALMLFGTGLAFYSGKPLIEPSAPDPAGDRFGWLERHPAGARRASDQRSVLIGVALAPCLVWALARAAGG
jgi:hypothetical protein